ncbi:coagulation factor XIII A chain-like [Clupea harengus]|uniref:Coagulation factor XIII A chain-like n=1 Tax=Clupea harengus TaxID=7950 RepID=A0A6P8GCR7_CLUHA|nr:coagulation factor XIII A chain-like [Clupea harengus]
MRAMCVSLFYSMIGDSLVNHFMYGDYLALPSPRTDKLVVQSVELHKDQNKAAHRTNSFKHDGLIIRRGQVFTLTVTFDRAYTPTDKVILEFTIGDNFLSDKETYISLNLGDSTGNKWETRNTVDGNTVTVDIKPLADCIVGMYCFNVIVVTPLGKFRTKRDPNTDFYILFNTWCPEDGVFLNNESQRTEYVLNEQGVIYNGETENVTQRPWNYGQHKRGVLEACFFVLNSTNMPLDNRRYAVNVARRGSAIINSKDDNGVVVGNWSNDYSMGTAPDSWTGSAEILLKYHHQSGVPVSFGQCLVFAGVLNTFFRSLGIPSRVITNYSSAHDNGGNIKTDIYVDENGSMDKLRTRDSVWNYHCWNEIWTTRRDLPERWNAAGWQVVDATPQEISEGQFRCGPTSVKAIKEGELCLPFDGLFVFAEVNSNVVYHSTDQYGQSKIVRVDTTYVGKKIYTKAVGLNMFEDITLTYKNQEGSASDRAAMERAANLGCVGYRSTLQPTNVTIAMVVPAVQLAQNFTLILEVKNTSTEQQTVQLTTTCSVTYYTGVSNGTFKEDRQTVSLGPLRTEQVTIEILAIEYMKYMVDKGSLSFTCVGKIQENSQFVTAARVVTLEVPSLSFKIDDKVRVGQEMSVTLEFTNVFNITLTQVGLRMEGPGEMGFKTQYYNAIDPGASLSWVESFVPDEPGEGRVEGCLNCPQLSQVCGMVNFNAQP